METSKIGKRAARVLVVDDDLTSRLRIKEILLATEGFLLAGDFTDIQEALNQASCLQPTLVLLAVQLARFNDFEYIRRFKRIVMGLKIVLLARAENADLIDASLRAGAEFCLVKPITPGQCQATLRCASYQQVNNEVEPPLPKTDVSHGTCRQGSSVLTKREREVLRGLAEGLLYKEIAQKLGITYSAVHKSQHRLFEKLRVSNRSEAVSAWFHTSLVESRDFVARFPSIRRDA